MLGGNERPQLSSRMTDEAINGVQAEAIGLAWSIIGESDSRGTY